MLYMALQFDFYSLCISVQSLARLKRPHWCKYRKGRTQKKDISSVEKLSVCYRQGSSDIADYTDVFTDVWNTKKETMQRTNLMVNKQELSFRYWLNRDQKRSGSHSACVPWSSGKDSSSSWKAEENPASPFFLVPVKKTRDVEESVLSPPYLRQQANSPLSYITYCTNW